MALSDLPRLQAGDITPLGSFTITGNVFAFGGHGLTFDPDGNGGAGSLWVSGSDATGHVPTLGQITIPAVGGVASVLTPATTIPNMPAPLDRTAGALIYNGRLIVSAYAYYEASNPHLSHWRSSDKTVANLGSPVEVGGVLNAAVYGGYMGLIPAEWQAALGGPCFTGQGAISIMPRGASWGPALFAFNPDDVNIVAPPVPVTTLMWFPSTNPLHNAYTTVVPNTTFNLTQAVAGAFFPPGTRSVCFMVGMGTGFMEYGTGQTTDPEAPRYDPFNSAQGYHAYPYNHVVLAFDALDLQAVKDGTKLPWTVRPYATWVLDGMGTENLRAFTRNGCAYDPASRRIYVANANANINFGGMPRIWVLEHAELTQPEPPLPPGPSTRGLGGTLFGPL